MKPSPTVSSGFRVKSPKTDRNSNVTSRHKRCREVADDQSVVACIPNETHDFTLGRAAGSVSSTVEPGTLPHTSAFRLPPDRVAPRRICRFRIRFRALQLLNQCRVFTLRVESLSLAAHGSCAQTAGGILAQSHHCGA